MRTSTTITETEMNAYNAFCKQHHILNDDSPAALENGNQIGNYVAVTWGEDITEHTLGVAMEQLKDRLTFISPQQLECEEILSKLDQSQRDAVASWLAKKQHRLEVDGPKGYSNVSVLCAWLLNRRYTIDAAGLDLALGNCLNGHRKTFWKDLPKADRSIGPGGKINHALVNKSPEGFMPRNQTNRTPRQVAEDNRPKSETPPTPVSVNVEYQAKAESLVGRTHGQTDQARKLFVMVPGTSTIDWQETHAARVRFLNTQGPLIRR